MAAAHKANTSTGASQTMPCRPSNPWRSGGHLYPPRLRSASTGRVSRIDRLQDKVARIEFPKRRRNLHTKLRRIKGRPIGNQYAIPSQCCPSYRFPPEGVKLSGRKRTPGMRRVFKKAASLPPLIQGAPSFSNGASVPRPTLMFVPPASRRRVECGGSQVPQIG